MQCIGNKKLRIEDNRMIKNNMSKVVKKRSVPKGAKIIDSTWTMDKESIKSYNEDGVR